MSRPRRLLAVVVSLVAVVFAVGGALYYSLDLDAIRRGLERSLSASFGVQVRLRGKVGLQFLPPGATFADIVIRDENREILTAKRVAAGIALLPLFRKEVRLSSLTFHAPTLHLWRNPDGSWPPWLRRKQTGALAIARVSVRGGVVSYTDAVYATETTLEGVEGSVNELRRNEQGRLSFIGDFRVRRLGFGRVELGDLKGKVAGAEDIYRIFPLHFGLFGNETTGTIEVNRRTMPPTWRAEFVARKMSLADLSRSLAGKPLYEGAVDVRANLAGDGSGRITETVDGTVSVSGTNLVQHGINVDRLIEEFRKSRDINPVDIAVVTFAGPMGALVTKGVEVARMIQTTRREDRQAIAELAFDWSLQDGVAWTRDVAIRTDKNRLAFKGAVDLAKARYDGMTLALLNKDGCAELTEKISGPLTGPAVEKVSMLGTLAQSLTGVIRKGWAIIDPGDCRPFYEGRVTQR
jgi:AsmA protein